MWFSFEVVNHGGETSFYVRVPSKHREIIRSAFYAHYQDIELEEVKDDHIYHFPRTIKELKELGYRIFGTDSRYQSGKRCRRGN